MTSHLIIECCGKLLLIAYTTETFSVGSSRSDAKRHNAIPIRQVIGAHLTDSSVEVFFLTKRRKKDYYTFVRIEGMVQGGELVAAQEWVAGLMDVAYAGVKRNKRLKVLINPHSGQGKAAEKFTSKVQPLFLAARCSLDVTHTTHHGHGFEIAKNLELDFDAVVAFSGDGMIHEVLNGFAQHKHPRKALNIPVVPIPTGSGNGLSLNLLGIEEGLDVLAAALNVIKGHPMKVDIFSLTQRNKRNFSFMSQALGLMADVDLGTENLRWMGDTRFIVGLLKGLIDFKACPIQLSIKVAEDNKMSMVQALQSRREEEAPMNGPLPPDLLEDTLPPLKYSMDDEDGWTTFEKPLLFVYAGKGPYVGRDFMPFPVSLPDDGLIDIVAQELSTRGEVLKAMGSGDGTTGRTYWSKSVRYYKAHAYRVKPLSRRGFFSVDGEEFPFEEFQVEVHQGLGTLLSPYGHYAVEFPLPSGKDVSLGLT